MTTSESIRIQALKKIRLVNGLTQKEMGEIIFINQSTYGNIERGKRALKEIEFKKYLDHFNLVEKQFYRKYGNKPALSLADKNVISYPKTAYICPICLYSTIVEGGTISHNIPMDNKYEFNVLPTLKGKHSDTCENNIMYNIDIAVYEPLLYLLQNNAVSFPDIWEGERSSILVHINTKTFVLLKSYHDIKFIKKNLSGINIKKMKSVTNFRVSWNRYNSSDIEDISMFLERFANDLKKG